MVVFLTLVLNVDVTDKTPEMSTRPLNDASPNVTLSAVTIPVNVGDALFACIVSTEENELSTISLYAVNEASTCSKLGLVFKEVSTCVNVGLVFKEVSTCVNVGLVFKEVSTCVNVGLVFNEVSTCVNVGLVFNEVSYCVNVGLVFKVV